MKTATQKPPFLIRYEVTQARALERSKEKSAAEREAAKDRARRYNRISFCREDWHLEDFFKWTPRSMSNADSLGDVCNALRDDLDFSEAYFGRHGRDVSDDMPDALALVQYLAPGVTRRALDAMREDIADDLRRAMCYAAESDYEAQFYHWLVDALESAADETGAEWAWLDNKGNPTEYPCEAARIGFAVSRRAYLDRAAEWWPAWWHDKTRSDWDNYANNRERLEAASDHMREHIGEKVKGAVDISHFDERGSIYADDAAWPDYFLDGMSSALDTWRADNAKMRARLRDMIRSRAPLEARAALVATVDGVPGTPFDDSEE